VNRISNFKFEISDEEKLGRRQVQQKRDQPTAIQILRSGIWTRGDGWNGAARTGL